MGDQEPKPVNWDQKIDMGLSEIRHYNIEIEKLERSRAHAFALLTRKIESADLPDELKLEANVIKNSGPEDVLENLRSIRKIANKLREARGQVIAWLDAQEHVTLHRDPIGPSETETTFTLKIGVLPENPELKFDFLGSYKIELDQAVNVNIFQFQIPLLPGDKEASITWGQVFGTEDGLPFMTTSSIDHSDEDISIEPTGIIALSGEHFYRLPLPAIGNTEVEELFDKYGLEHSDGVATALELLRTRVVAKNIQRQ